MRQLLEHRDLSPEASAFPAGQGPPSSSQPSGTGIAEVVSRCYHMRTQWDLQLMEAVAEAERRGIYAEDGFGSTAEWLATYLGIGYRSALKFAEVALALEQLPRMAEAYGAGRISYDHLRALVEVASPDNEADLLEAVEGLTVADTFRLIRKILEISAEDSLLSRRERWLEMRWDHDRRQLIVFAQLPEDQGARVEKAIDALAGKIPDDPSHEAARTPMGVKRADALCEMAGSALAAEGSRSQVVVHVDVDTLCSGVGVAGIEDGPAISPETARRLSCDALVQAVLDGKDGKPIGAGRRNRTVDPKLLTGLRRRDQTCRFPGCRRRKGLQAHHMVHWACGGATDYDNLILLCELHHFLVHEGGYTLRGDPPKVWVERPGRPPLKVGPPRLGEEAAAFFEWELALSLPGAAAAPT